MGAEVADSSMTPFEVGSDMQPDSVQLVTLSSAVWMRRGDVRDRILESSDLSYTMFSLAPESRSRPFGKIAYHEGLHLLLIPHQYEVNTNLSKPRLSEATLSR